VKGDAETRVPPTKERRRPTAGKYHLAGPPGTVRFGIDMRWLSYLSLLIAAATGSCVFLNVLYEMWQLEGLAPKLFTFCSLTTALIHCATVRSYHLPLAIVTGIPVVATIMLTVVSSLVAEDRLVDTIIGMVIVMLMIGYIAIMMIEGSRSRRVLIAARTEADAANEAKGMTCWTTRRSKPEN